MSPKALIIGGNRFFGRHLISTLVERNYEVTLFNRQSRDDGFGSNVNRVKGDRDQAAELNKIAHHNWDFVFDQVCYTASQAKSACDVFAGNVGRYIVTSSKSVYDWSADIREADFDPHKHHYIVEADRYKEYGEAKRQMESVFYNKATFPVIAVRFPIVLGLDDYTKRLVWHIERNLKGLDIYAPNLKAGMGYVDSKEAGVALADLAKTEWNKPINIASPGTITLEEIANLIEKNTHIKTKFVNTASEENHSPFGVSQTTYMNLDQMFKLGLKTNPLMMWFPDLVRKSVANIV